MARRSVLFSPGHRPELLRKAARTGADVLVFDLEDAVPPDRRDEAREAIGSVLSDPDFEPAAEVCVRINRHETGARDLDAIETAAAPPDALMIPKVTDPDEVAAVADRVVARLGRSLPLFVLLERAGGIERAPEIASVNATDALVFGAEDLGAEIGATTSTDLHEVSYARQRVVLGAAIGGVDPIDTVFTDFEDREGLARQARTARQLGYVGKLAIHPEQVEPIHAAFMPAAGEVEWARRVVSAATDRDGVFEVDGEMVDAPVRKRAERILHQAGEDPDHAA